MVKPKRLYNRGPNRKIWSDGRFVVVEGASNSIVPKKLPRIQAPDWLAPQEANVNNNNSLEAPFSGLLFGGKLEERNCHHPAPHQTSNHAQLVQRKSRMVLYSKASSGNAHHDQLGSAIKIVPSPKKKKMIAWKDSFTNTYIILERYELRIGIPQELACSRSKIWLRISQKIPGPACNGLARHVIGPGLIEKKT